MGGKEFKWHQLAHHQLISQQGPHFSPHTTAKTNNKSTFLRKNGLLVSGNVTWKFVLVGGAGCANPT